MLRNTFKMFQHNYKISTGNNRFRICFHLRNDVVNRFITSIFDGFISCWDEKYRSVRIRPETVINNSIDKKWIPILQTPPFPEYTSGHSTISSAAATVLTNIYGDNVAFNDSTEIPYGLPPRKFTSFKQAADEASISRLYGGIHFRPALDQGVIQGGKVAQQLLKKVKTH